MSQLVRSQFLPLPREDVFRFFAQPRNLEAITPPWLRFRILERPSGDLETGSLIDYALRVHGLPLRWRSKITRWDPPFAFVDEQVRGPYRRWVHTHSFEEIEGGTRVCDHIDYEVLGGKLIDGLFVRRDLRKIFDFRAKAIATRFDLEHELSCV